MLRRASSSACSGTSSAAPRCSSATARRCACAYGFGAASVGVASSCGYCARAVPARRVQRARSIHAALLASTQLHINTHGLHAPPGRWRPGCGAPSGLWAACPAHTSSGGLLGCSAAGFLRRQQLLGKPAKQRGAQEPRTGQRTGHPSPSADCQPKRLPSSCAGTRGCTTRRSRTAPLATPSSSLASSQTSSSPSGAPWVSAALAVLGVLGVGGTPMRKHATSCTWHVPNKVGHKVRHKPHAPPLQAPPSWARRATPASSPPSTACPTTRG